MLRTMHAHETPQNRFREEQIRAEWCGYRFRPLDFSE